MALRKRGEYGLVAILSISLLLARRAQSLVTTTQTVDSALKVLAGNIAICLIESDKKRDSGFDGASTGWTSWVEESSALRLQNCFDLIGLQNDNDSSDSNNDSFIQWMHWIKATPAPTIYEVTPQIRHLVSECLPEQVLTTIDSTRDEFLQRIGCRLIILPSGDLLPTPLKTPTGSMIYGKCLLGGVTRYRIIGKRKAGERRVVATRGQQAPSWLQYGGPLRNYNAVDMGPCLLLELILQPKGLQLEVMGGASFAIPKQENYINTNDNDTMTTTSEEEQRRTALHWDDDAPYNDNTLVCDTSIDLESMFDFYTADTSGNRTESTNTMSTRVDHEYTKSSFCANIGGLGPQIDEIVRRVLDGRVYASSSDYNNGSDGETKRRQEMQELMALGLHPVKGLLLYGPAGCGKTALARELSNILSARPPKIVSAPELLDRWVGGSERLIRDLFVDAEAELRRCNGDATKSGLHVIVIDECDAVFRYRSASDSASEVTRASAVNQILSKLDGVNELNNCLLIGMTNRKELLDPALLRPGRLEVHIEIGLPDAEGRREILKIHFDALRRQGRLSGPLCRAIDGCNDDRRQQDHISNSNDNGNKESGLKSIQSNLHTNWFSKVYQRKRRQKKEGAANNSVGAADAAMKIIDLAADEWTFGYSGADIAGLVRCAGSIALSRARMQGSGDISGLLITLDDVYRSLNEIKQ